PSFYRPGLGAEALGPPRRSIPPRVGTLLKEVQADTQVANASKVGSGPRDFYPDPPGETGGCRRRTGGTDGLATGEQEGTGHRLDRRDRLRHRLPLGPGGGFRRGQRPVSGPGRGSRPAYPEREERRPGDGGGGRPGHEGRRGPGDENRPGAG